jgi:hypothetical protein
MENNNDLMRVLLAELVDELGGIVKLDASKILANAKKNKFKRIGLRIDGNDAIIEVFDEDEE